MTGKENLEQAQRDGEEIEKGDSEQAMVRELFYRFGLDQAEEIARAMRIPFDQAKILIHCLDR